LSPHGIVAWRTDLHATYGRVPTRKSNIQSKPNEDAMRLVCCFATAFLTLSLAPALGADTAVDRAKRDEIMAVPKGDPDMEAAFHKARETLTDFLALARAPRPSIDNMAVKSPSAIAMKPSISGSVLSKKRTVHSSARSTTHRAASTTSSSAR
jgi:hypothetical protein